MTKIIQICVCAVHDSDDSIYGLDDAGNLYISVGVADWSWKLITPHEKERKRA